MIQSLRLLLQGITDSAIRSNFEKIERYVTANGQLDGFKFLEVTKNSNEANFKLAHGLPSVPKDALITRLIAPTSSVKLSINWGLCDGSNMDLTVTGLAAGETMSARLFVGTFKGSESAAPVESSDIEQFKGRQ